MAALARFGLATLVAAAAAGCSLLIDVDGLSGGPAGPGAEAGADVAVASVDAGADAADAADAADGSMPPCAPPAFCDDFERGDPIGAWDGLQTTGGTLAIDATMSRSGTRSLRAALVASATTRSVYLERLVPAGTLGVKVSFSFRIESSPATTNVLAGLQLGTPLSTVFVSVNGSSLGLLAQNYVTAEAHGYPVGATKLGEWDRITMDLRRTTPSGTPRLRVTRGTSATLVVDEAVTVPLGALGAYRIGIIYAAADPASAQAWFDDVRVDLD